MTVYSFTGDYIILLFLAFCYYGKLNQTVSLYFLIPGTDTIAAPVFTRTASTVW